MICKIPSSSAPSAVSVAKYGFYFLNWLCVCGCIYVCAEGVDRRKRCAFFVVVVFKNIPLSLKILTCSLLLFPPSLCSFLEVLLPSHLPPHPTHAPLCLGKLPFQDATLSPAHMVKSLPRFCSNLPGLLTGTHRLDFCNFHISLWLCPLLSSLQSSPDYSSTHSGLGQPEQEGSLLVL